ncbi:sensor histidine kinase [Halanaerobium hydrogeniformans]|uniref:histidine kinase n=1 Tax=Halanaerobium hydrogeniformans TaxID=656519 RepID=E4RKI9_HALHG|nr:HAMP domain-containing sensor histidine kinase [Halanaerobium hydrogeniformans]ADQ14698.1 integral membrane sensor signal transduction histidine kinase [Halanaerobium hydrogeniformans]
MSKLGKKLFIIFLILVVFSMLLVGLFINYSIGERFDDFINLQQQESIEELLEMLRENFEAGSRNEINSLLNNFVRTHRIPVWLEDRDGNIIFAPTQHHQMMRRMMGDSHMVTERSDFLPGQSRREEIYVEDSLQATLYWQEVSSREQIDSELYNYFRRNVFQAIIFSALIVIVLVIIISFIISRIITEPLIKLKNAAFKVAEGDFDQKISNNGDDELAELITAFNQMTEKLVKLEKIRKESASDLAHELRTPITTIKGYIEAFEDGKISLNQENLDELKEEIARMVSLIEKLKEFAEAQNKIFNLQKEQIEINKLIKNVSKKKLKQIESKNIKLNLELEKELIIEADKDSLIQILNNLIENAVKYNRDNGKITIKSCQRDNNIIIQISDTGYGISREDLPYIFERFYRADKSRSSENGGTGIGLAVTKELIEAHGAKIEVDSNNNGSIFKIIFPV